MYALSHILQQLISSRRSSWLCANAAVGARKSAKAKKLCFIKISCVWEMLAYMFSMRKPALQHGSEKSTNPKAQETPALRKGTQ
ncbi:MAG: hypothetical protein AAGG02_20050, partial [Cyanobacteria bacterium P01_H01_bin.15]